MKQFLTILSFELKYYFKNKVFVGITIFLVALIAGVMCFPRISDAFSEENGAVVEDVSADRAVMLVKAEAPDQAMMTEMIFSAVFADYEVRLTEMDTDSIQAQITAGEAECAFVMTGVDTYIYYVNNLAMYDMNTAVASEALQQLYQMSAMMESGMSMEEAEQVMNIQITGEVVNLGKDQMENFSYTYIMIFALYMVILLYGQMVSTNVATEKSSRAMEVLITSAKPTSMMFGKVLASCLAGLSQLLMVFGAALLFYNFNQSYWDGNPIVASIFNIPPELLVYMLIFFVLGFLIYAFLFGAIGSTATKVEDINTSTLPLMFLFIIAFMVVMFSMTSGDIENLVMKVCSYIPFTSPMAMFTRIAMSTVAWYEIAISIGILIGSVIGVGIISAKIYRVGVLLYGTTPKITAIVKAVWKA